MANNVDYNDPNHYSVNDLTLEQALNGIAHKIYGRDVRFALIQYAERIKEIVTNDEPQDVLTSEDLNQLSVDLDEKINRLILGTDETTVRVVVEKILQEKGII